MSSIIKTDTIVYFNIPSLGFNNQLDSTAYFTVNDIGELTIVLYNAGSIAHFPLYDTIKLIVAKRPLTIKAINMQKYYGDPNPSLEFSITGFLNYDSMAKLKLLPGIRTNASVNSLPGECMIFLDGGYDSNYSFNFINVTLEILKRPLIVSVLDTNRYFGVETPIFTINYNGILNGDNLEMLEEVPTPYCNATTTSAPGEFEILIGGGKDSRYDFSYISGKLKILESEFSFFAYPNPVSKNLLISADSKLDFVKLVNTLGQQ
ncbi:MAG: MBG domain-containing protein, partial [Cyclobacteriaceae bacterium]|nr:MBG domain-containing protein [Cyclobacteriaceae bacterium]